MPLIANRYDFVLLFDVTNGNPNGDPDAGNMPRLDPETSHGLVSDVSLKRKIRNYAEFAKSAEPGYAIYVQQGSILNEQHRRAYAAVRGDGAATAGAVRLNPKSDEEAARLGRFMCENFFDVRVFGAVMSTGINCGQIRGPVQFSFAHSVEPVTPLEIAVTRMAGTTSDDRGTRDGDEARRERRTIGRKYIVPYGLYRAHGYVSAKLAERTGFSQDDLAFLWEAIANMFEHDRSAARGDMAVRRLTVFRHESALGNAPAHALFERVAVSRVVADTIVPLASPSLDDSPPARRYSDYQVAIDRRELPRGVELLELV